MKKKGYMPTGTLHRLNRDAETYENDLKLIRERTYETIKGHPYSKAHSIKTYMSDRYWSTDIDDAIEHLILEGRVGIRQQGPWDVLIAIETDPRYRKGAQ